MDEALAKTGEWPNVAIEAGSDPADVMERYDVKPSMRDLWSFTELVKKSRVEERAAMSATDELRKLLECLSGDA